MFLVLSMFSSSMSRSERPVWSSILFLLVYGTARCVDHLKMLSYLASNTCTDYSFYVSIIPCASWLQNYRLTFMWRWAMVRSFHVSIHPRLCGFSPSLHVTLMCVHVSQVLDQMVQESSTGWLSKIIHKWRVVEFRLVEYGQLKLSVTKLSSHRLEESKTKGWGQTLWACITPIRKILDQLSEWSLPTSCQRIFVLIQTGNSIFKNWQLANLGSGLQSPNLAR